MYYFYLYKVTNLQNNKIYVGVHKTKNLEDGYMGSGKSILNAIKKYGIENFRKDILEYFDSYEDALVREKEVVTEEFLSRKDTYNLRRGGYGGFDWINKKGLNWTSEKQKRICPFRTEEFLKEQKKNKWLEKGGKKIGGWNKGMPSFFKKHSKETIEKLKGHKRQVGSKNSQFGTMWITNGIRNKKIKKDDKIPPGWAKGLTPSK